MALLTPMTDDPFLELHRLIDDLRTRERILLEAIARQHALLMEYEADQDGDE